MVGVGHAIRPAAGLRGISEEGGVLDVVVNVGGFGQTEEQLVVQSEQRLFAGEHTTGTGSEEAAVRAVEDVVGSRPSPLGYGCG